MTMKTKNCYNCRFFKPTAMKPCEFMKNPTERDEINMRNGDYLYEPKICCLLKEENENNLGNRKP